MVCVAAYDPNDGQVVRLGHGLPLPSAPVDMDSAETRDTVYVYKLVRGDTFAVMRRVAKETRSSIEGVKGDFHGVVEGARRELEESIKEKERASGALEGATNELVESVEREQKEAAAASAMDKLKEAQDDVTRGMEEQGHGRDFSKYASSKGAQMQGFVDVFHGGGRVGRWSQSGGDVEVWIEAGMGATVEISKRVVCVRFAEGGGGGDGGGDGGGGGGTSPMSPEEEEFAQSNTMVINLLHPVNATDSTWLIDDGTVCVNLVKADAAVPWEKLDGRDSASAVFRDYGKVAESLGGQAVPAEKTFGAVVATVGGDEIVVKLVARGDLCARNVWRDYAVLCRTSLSPELSATDYDAFEYLFEEEVSEDCAAAESCVRFEITPEVRAGAAQYEGEFEVRICDHVTHEVMARSGAFVFVEPGRAAPVRFVEAVREGVEVRVEWQTKIQVVAVFVTGAVDIDAEYSWALSEEALVIEGSGEGVTLVKLGLIKPLLDSLDDVSIAVCDGYVAIRIHYTDGGAEWEEFVQGGSEAGRSSPASMGGIACKFCTHPLVTGGITKCLPLPASFWDEITDYLACHSSAPVNFNSASVAAKRGVAMEDEGVVLLHEDDVGEETSVMGIEGYLEAEGGGGGEEGKDGINFRGEREWSCGGATVCCNRCCSVVGFASLMAPESIRLYKHRLEGAGGEVFGGVAGFLAREMCRYADTQAVFRFVGVCSGQRKRVVMKLLAWDAVCGLGLADVSKCAKILWGVEDWVEEEGGGEGHEKGEGGDEGLFEWADMCCRGGGGAEKGEKGTVKVFLGDDEWPGKKRGGSLCEQHTVNRTLRAEHCEQNTVNKTL